MMAEAEVESNEAQDIATIFRALEPFMGFKRQPTGETVLMHLVKQDKIVAVQYALGSKWDEKEEEFVIPANMKARCEVDAQDRQGKTALHWAIVPSEKYSKSGYRQSGMIQTLIESKCDPSIKDKKGVSVVNIAKTDVLIR